MTSRDLDIARSLAAAGIPVLVAYPDPEGKTPSGRATGYALRGGWQATTPNPDYVSAWKPGLALVAVMGRGIDLVDIDPRNGGDAAALTGIIPDVIGAARSPSGGYHLFVRSMGVRSRDGVLPGIDVKAGDTEGQGRGFAFIAPTVRPSKITGEPAAYEWVTAPDITRLNGITGTDSKLADLVRSAHGSRKTTATGFTQPAQIERKHTGPIPYGEHHSQLVSYAGWLRSKEIPLHPEAETLMLRRLSDVIQPPGASRPVYTEEEALTELCDVYERYASGDPAAEQAASPETPPAALPDFDLGALAAAGIKEPDRIAGGMLYPGSVHCLAGAPGGGKTTLMAWWLLQHIRAGGNVMFLDEESGAEHAAEKFLDLGAQPGELRPPRFTYVPFPSRSWTLSDRAQLFELVRERAPGIIGWDSVAAFLAIAGADENSAADVTKFWQQILIPCAREFTAAVIGIDHLVKNGEHSGYGRGSGAKKAASDVQYILETIRPFNRHQSGTLRLTTSPGKDRRGWLAVAYEIHVKIGETIILDIAESLTQITGRIEMKPGQANLWEALKTIASEQAPASYHMLNDWLAANGRRPLTRQVASKYLNELSEDGLADFISYKPGQEKYWYPLTLSPDTSPDRYTDLSPDTPPDSLTGGVRRVIPPVGDDTAGMTGDTPSDDTPRMRWT